MRWCNISIPWITLWPFMCILNVILFRFGIEIVWDGARWVPHEPPSVLLLCPLSEWGEPPSALQLPSYPSISQQVCIASHCGEAICIICMQKVTFEVLTVFLNFIDFVYVLYDTLEYDGWTIPPTPHTPQTPPPPKFLKK